MIIFRCPACCRKRAPLELGSLFAIIVPGEGDSEVAGPGQDDELNILEAGVALHHLAGAEGFLDLAPHIILAVFHEDGRVGVALRHLLLALYTSRTLYQSSWDSGSAG